MPALGPFLPDRQHFAELLQMQLLLTELFDVGGTVAVPTLAPAGFGDNDGFGDKVGPVVVLAVVVAAAAS